MYKVFWDQGALEDLKGLDKDISIRLVKKVDSYLSQNPNQLGKPLSKEFKGLYLYIPLSDRFAGYSFMQIARPLARCNLYSGEDRLPRFARRASRKLI